MYIDNPILDQIILEETCRESLHALTPGQLAAIALRWHDGLSNTAIAELFGLTHQAVAARLAAAHRNLVGDQP